MADRVTAGERMFSDLSFYPPVRHVWLELGEEVVAIFLALSQTKCLCDKFTHVGITTD